MYQTLDELECALITRKKRSFSFSSILKEVKVLLFIFVVVFLWMYLVTNAQLVIDNITDHFAPVEVHGISDETSMAMMNLPHNKNSDAVDSLIEEYWGMLSLEQDIAPDMDHYLQTNLDSYEFSFNLLPPTNRLIIPAINLDVPLVETNIHDYDDFNESTFDADLENGVVKYPTTPNPGEWWNAFFFWHTSQEYWKTNPYGTVFRNIPRLQHDDQIQVVRDGVLYEYKVVKILVVKPKEVNNVYVGFWEEWKEYITLMWCYPIGRTDKRMMVFAERIS